MHLYVPVKGGVGSKLGVLTHLTGVGERGCHSWNNVSFQTLYTFFSVYPEGKLSFLFILVFWGSNVVWEKQNSFFFFVRSGRTRAINYLYQTAHPLDN